MMQVCGQIDSALSFDDLARSLNGGQWQATVGRYAIRLGGSFGDCKFISDATGYLLENIDGADLVSAARSLSAHLRERGLRHRLEIYDAKNELLVYLHHDWPRV